MYDQKSLPYKSELEANQGHQLVDNLSIEQEKEINVQLDRKIVSFEGMLH